MRAFEASLWRRIPDHHVWYGRPLHFKTRNVDAIVAELVESGALDTGAPSAVFALGAQYFRYPWSITSSWVYLGFCMDLVSLM
eukprot:m51a1_g12534 hypothetical protein (83) ;mRNA; f:579-897